MALSGKYAIYNRVLSPTGHKLAITYGSANHATTVTPLDNSANQLWKITPYDGSTFTVTPVAAPSLQIGWGNNGPTPMTPGNYVWTIKAGDSGYTIQDGGKTVNWNLGEASDNHVVSIGGDQGIERYRWILDRVD